MLNDASWGAVLELAASQHGVFTTAQAANQGISHKRLASATKARLLHRVRRGVYRIASQPQTWHSEIMAATLATNAVASHRAAARLHQLDGFSRSSLLEVTTSPGRSTRQQGVHVHNIAGLRPSDLTSIRGIPTTDRAVTVCLLASVVDTNKVEAALDAAIRMGTSYRRIVATELRLRRRGPAGTRQLPALLAARDLSHHHIRRYASEFEAACGRWLAAAGLPQPVTQHRIGVRDGRTFRFDFAWPAINLALECHSRQHHFGRQAVEADSNRDLVVSAEGWEIIYLTYGQLTDADNYMPHLVELIRRRMKHFRHPSPQRHHARRP